MPHTEASWRAEIQAHAPQTCDFVELATAVPDLSSWRVEIAGEPGLRDCLETWEGFVQLNKLAVPIEQSTDDGVLASENEVEDRLAGCPADSRKSVGMFFAQCPEVIREYLAYSSYCLVQIERQRRTRCPEWRHEAASGSPEVLRELMFKWGPRFRRHRWTW